jgi:hypothetical protein
VFEFEIHSRWFREDALAQYRILSSITNLGMKDKALKLMAVMAD